MRVIRVLSVMVVCLSASTTATLLAGQAPTGTTKDVISIVQQDGTKVSLQAQRASWKPIRAAFRAEGRRGVPAESLVIVKDPVSIEAPFASRDLAGGALFIVKLKKDKTEFTFQGDAAGTPDKGDVLAKTSDLKSAEKDGVTAYALDPSRKLKAGYYAIVMLDNQYMWPFEIR